MSLVNVVIDDGSKYCKAGYGGTKRPKGVIPTALYNRATEDRGYIGRKALNENSVSLADDSMVEKGALRRPISRGAIENWEDMGTFWEYIVETKLQLKSDSCNVLLTNRASTLKEDRERATQLFFEKLDVSGFFIGMSPVLTLYSVGLITGLAVECGAETIETTPVKDGRTITSASEKVDFGGTDVGDWLWKKLIETERGTQYVEKLNTQFQAVETAEKQRREKEEEDFAKKMDIDNQDGGEEEEKKRFDRDRAKKDKKLRKAMKKLGFQSQQDLVDRLVKHKLCFIAPKDLDEELHKIQEDLVVLDTQRSRGRGGYKNFDVLFGEKHGLAAGYGVYSLPDGKQIKLLSGFAGKDDDEPTTFTDDDKQFRTTLMKLFLQSGEAIFSPSSFLQESASPLLGVQEIALESIVNCGDFFLRKELFGNVVISGGYARMRGFGRRLEYELRCRAPIGVNVSVREPEHNRQYAAWRGASILSQISSFEDMWVTKEDYDEVGPSVVHKRCPS